eukprot:SAG31_NODE_3542_length_4143_cov_2.092977_3_plen_138_part_00
MLTVKIPFCVEIIRCDNRWIGDRSMTEHLTIVDIGKSVAEIGIGSAVHSVDTPQVEELLQLIEAWLQQRTEEEEPAAEEEQVDVNDVRGALDSRWVRLQKRDMPHVGAKYRATSTKMQVRKRVGLRCKPRGHPLSLL